MARSAFFFVLPTAVRDELIQNPPVPFMHWHTERNLIPLWQRGDVYLYEATTLVNIEASVMQVMLGALHTEDWEWEDHPFDIGDVIALDPFGQPDEDEKPECYLLTAYGFKAIDWVEQKHPEPASA